MTKNKIVCPRCFGNGYIRIPNKAVGFDEQVIAQCTMCDSQGEINEVARPNDTNNANKLQ